MTISARGWLCYRSSLSRRIEVKAARQPLSFYLYYGDNFKIECPTGSGKLMNLFEVAKEIANRLTGIFLQDKSGRRPVYGGTEKFQTDPQWKDYILFFEYFHGDNGAGLGASHQTGWTGVIAKLIELFGRMDGPQLLQTGKSGAFAAGRTQEVETMHVKRVCAPIKTDIPVQVSGQNRCLC